MVADRANFAIEMATTSKLRPELLEIPLELDPAAGNQSLQVNRALRHAILEGRLGAGLRLPSSRALAGQLGLRRNAIIAAYEHLASDGFVETRSGAGTYVAATLPARPAAPATQPPDRSEMLERRRPFTLGHTHGDRTLLKRFGAALRRRTVAADPAGLDYGIPAAAGSCASRSPHIWGPIAACAAIPDRSW